eukprot:gene17331-17157_t
MVYGLASFSGCPWTTVIERFKASALCDQPSLGDVEEALLSFLATLGLPGGLVTDWDNLETFVSFVSHGVDEFHTLFLRLRQWNDGKSEQELLIETLDQFREMVSSRKEVTASEQKSVPRARIGSLTPVLEKLIVTYMDELVGQAAEHVFTSRVPPRPIRQELAAILQIGLLTDWMPGWMPTTGVVIAGFGRDDVFPRAHRME